MKRTPFSLPLAGRDDVCRCSRRRSVIASSEDCAPARGSKPGITAYYSRPRDVGPVDRQRPIGFGKAAIVADEPPICDRAHIIDAKAEIAGLEVALFQDCDLASGLGSISPGICILRKVPAWVPWRWIKAIELNNPSSVCSA